MQIPSLRRMIGQMLLAGFPGAAMPDTQALRLMEEYSVGNFILFARNIGSAVETARVCGALSEAVYAKTGFAPFLAVDQEGGAVLRAHERSLAFPGAMALAAATHAAAGGDVSPIREVGRRAGSALRALGMNVNFAPVLDVNSEPQNPVIGVRAYGDSPGTVTACGLAMAEGLRAGGVLPVFKHFPGHGNVSVDSHIGLPVNDAPRAALERTEWAPFSAGVSRFGMDAGVMTAHLVCRALEGGKDVPGTLSPRASPACCGKPSAFPGWCLPIAWKWARSPRSMTRVRRPSALWRPGAMCSPFPIRLKPLPTLRMRFKAPWKAGASQRRASKLPSGASLR